MTIYAVVLFSSKIFIKKSEYSVPHKNDFLCYIKKGKTIMC